MADNRTVAQILADQGKMIVPINMTLFMRDMLLGAKGMDEEQRITVLAAVEGTLNAAGVDYEPVIPEDGD